MKKFILMTMVALTIFAASCAESTNPADPNIYIKKGDVDFETEAGINFRAIKVVDGDIIPGTGNGSCVDAKSRLTVVGTITSTALGNQIKDLVEAKLGALGDKGIAPTCTVEVRQQYPLHYGTVHVNLKANDGYLFVLGEDNASGEIAICITGNNITYD